MQNEDSFFLLLFLSPRRRPCFALSLLPPPLLPLKWIKAGLVGWRGLDLSKLVELRPALSLLFERRGRRRLIDVILDRLLQVRGPPGAAVPAEEVQVLLLLLGRRGRRAGLGPAAVPLLRPLVPPPGLHRVGLRLRPSDQAGLAAGPGGHGARGGAGGGGGGAARPRRREGAAEKVGGGVEVAHM